MNKVSVIVPVYKTEEYLRKCILSILNQTYKNIELVIVNDNSPDNSQKIIDEYKEYKNVINIVQENKGLGGARNTGIEYSTGDYLMFVDSDDYLPINAIELMMENIKDAEVLVGNMLIKSGENEIPVGYIDKILKKAQEDKFYNLKDFEESIFLTSACNKLYKSSFIKTEIIKFEEKMKWEDNPFYIKVWLKSSEILFINEVVYIRLERDDEDNKSITQTFNINSLIDDRKSFCIVFEELKSYKRYDLLSMFLLRFYSATLYKYSKLEHKDKCEGRRILKKNTEIIKREKQYIMSKQKKSIDIVKFEINIFLRKLKYVFKGVI